MKQTGAAHEPAGDEPITFEAREALLHGRERSAQEPGEFSRIALPKQLEGEQEPCAGL